MSFSAKVVLDSFSPENIRLTTFELRYPRMVHAELMTHRMFSRNASSSRAIPVSKMIQSVIDDPAMPVYWGKNQSGMQAGEELEGQEREDAIALWLEARDAAVVQARRLNDAGLHKQIVNRVLEPFGHITVLVSATNYANWFALRDHKDAQPEIRRLAELMRIAYGASFPKALKPGEWHLPYVREDELTFTMQDVHVSVARCARVSYLTHDNEQPKLENDLKLYDRLVGGTPLHASPTEHQATPDFIVWSYDALHGRNSSDWGSPTLHGNFSGWIQYRKMLAGECVS